MTQAELGLNAWAEDADEMRLPERRRERHQEAEGKQARIAKRERYISGRLGFRHGWAV